jgi:peptidoglycan/LPS O-acetylase OafA/YrhL
MEAKAVARNRWLDWLRVLAILVVFVYHTFRFFNVEDWHVKNPTWYPFGMKLLPKAPVAQPQRPAPAGRPL